MWGFLTYSPMNKFIFIVSVPKCSELKLRSSSKSWIQVFFSWSFTTWMRMFPTLPLKSVGTSQPLAGSQLLCIYCPLQARLHNCTLLSCAFDVHVCNTDFFFPSKLLLYERNWLNRWKTSVLHEGEGCITNIQWRANLIAWANNVVSDPSMIGQNQKYSTEC